MGKEISARGILAKAEAGEAISVAEANHLFPPEVINLDELVATAGKITRSHFGNSVEMCAIYPAKVGRCSGNCAFCAQSVYHKSDAAPVTVSELNEDEIVENAAELWRRGVKRYSLVTSGERLTESEFARILHILNRLAKETKMGLCASLGGLTPERAARLKAAGVSRYHHNIETSRSFFPSVCSTHSYEDKLITLDIARSAGLEVCSGGIISMGESTAQRVEMAFALKELDVDCVPINILDPVPGTRLENQRILSTDEILRTIAVFRLIMPDKPLRYAGGREKALGDSEYAGYSAGITAMIVGNYLTTAGKSFEKELSSLKLAGLSVC